MMKRAMQRKAQGNWRELFFTPSLSDFASNDYLGLARSPLLASLTLEELQGHDSFLNGLGSTGSRLLTGHTVYAQELERSIAQFHGLEAGLLFSCGYMANVGLFSTVGGLGDIYFFDAGIHASTRDGMRLSHAQAFPFRHNDMEHLETRLKRCQGSKNRFICVESLYSTDGSIAPLQDLCQLAQLYHAHLIIDEAHAVGVLGPQGKGLCAAQNVMPHIFAQVITFGKALGAYGAIILGSSELKEFLLNFAHSCMYTTALPFQALGAIQASYRLFPQCETERQHLCKLIQLCQKRSFTSSSSHIQGIKVPGNHRAKEAAYSLARKGFDVRALLSPTVQKGHEVLRLALHAFNTENDLTTLLDICAELLS